MQFCDLKVGDYFTSPDLVRGLYLKIEDMTGDMKTGNCYIFCPKSTLHKNYNDKFRVQLTDQNGQPIERKIKFSSLKAGTQFSVNDDPKEYTKLKPINLRRVYYTYMDESYQVYEQINDFDVKLVD